MRRVAGVIGAVSAALACGLGGEAGAQEYCVACSEPSALYRCVIEGAQPRGGQSLQMLCVTTMAREGGHATCGVKRGTVFECDGAVKRVPWTALEAAPAQPAPGQPQPWVSPPAPRPQPAATPAAPPPASDPETPPQTVLEMAKRANDKTVEQMKKAGDTVKDATRKTWDCMLSLFTRC